MTQSQPQRRADAARQGGQPFGAADDVDEHVFVRVAEEGGLVKRTSRE